MQSAGFFYYIIPQTKMLACKGILYALIQEAQDAIASKRKAPKTCVARISAHIISYFAVYVNAFLQNNATLLFVRKIVICQSFSSVPSNAFLST